jgi:hypothetical protein
LLGGEGRVVDREAAGARLALEQGGDLADQLGSAAFAGDDRGELREALRLCHHQAIEGERRRRKGGAQYQAGQALQNLLQLPPS